MKTNTELLCKALGWQGGTVHQVAKETGLTISEIINGNRFAENDNHGKGWSATRTNSLAFNLSTCFPAHLGDVSFWMGVAAGEESKEKFPVL